VEVLFEKFFQNIHENEFRYAALRSC
jgi:hypothetical protein